MKVIVAFWGRLNFIDTTHVGRRGVVSDGDDIAARENYLVNVLLKVMNEAQNKKVLASNKIDTCGKKFYYSDWNKHDRWSCSKDKLILSKIREHVRNKFLLIMYEKCAIMFMANIRMERKFQKMVLEIQSAAERQWNSTILTWRFQILR